MKREDCLNQAITQVTGKRTQDYGTPENNFQIIADFWTLYLARRFGFTGTIITTDVVLMMDLLKTSRLINCSKHADSWIDKAGYSACGAEVSDA